jgi:LysR family transcriptional regulator for metE and metH
MNQLEIKHLRMICTLVETGNVTRAAKRLFISQSALSQQLKDIEGKLGIDLFYRTRKKMILTPTGKKLLETARHVVDTLEETELEISRIVSGDTGELKVGTQCIFCFKWLPRVMRFFQNKFPNVEVEIGTADNLPEDLTSKRFDLIITVPPEEDEAFVSAPLFEDQLVCIMHRDHPLSAREFIDFEDLSNTSLITHAEKNKCRFYQVILKPRGIEPKRFMTISQPQAILEMVAAGFGIATPPRWAVRSALETMEIVARPLTRTGLPLTWHAIYLNNNNPPVFQNEFINIVRKSNIPFQPNPLEGIGERVADG